jgi:hypothetical protein
MKAVYGLYPHGHAAQEAVDSLRAAGLSDRQITVISSQPMEDYEFGRKDKQTWMWWIAAGGGAAGLATGTWLTRMAQTAWPLPTGGMPITPWWPNLIIMFELTMLGAILATVATLLVTAGLPSRGSRLYDADVTNGKILVGVENPPDGSIGTILGALGIPRGGLVKTV